MNLDMVKPEKHDHLDLDYHFIIPLNSFLNHGEHVSTSADLKFNPFLSDKQSVYE